MEDVLSPKQQDLEKRGIYLLPFMFNQEDQRIYSSQFRQIINRKEIKAFSRQALNNKIILINMGCGNSTKIVKGNKSMKYQMIKQDFDKNKTSFIVTDEKKRTFNFKNELYIEEKQIGTGGFSDVYLYKNSSNGSLHALKILKDNTTSEAFLQEYQIMKDVESQFIIRIEEIIKIDNQLCIMMEYADQGTLGSFISSLTLQTININANQILSLICDIFQGLDIMHAKKIIHRDLKMDNLLVSNYQIKIADLGVATYLISQSYAQTNIGNVLYAAPEKLNEIKKYNSASDIYSAGLIILQMILGISDYEVLKLKINHNYINQIEESPESLRNFIQQLLNPNPEERLTANKAFNIGRKLMYDQEVLNYLNNRINPQFFYKKNHQAPPYIHSGLQSDIQQSTVMTLTNFTSNLGEDQLFEQGMQLYWKQDYEEAVSHFLKILEKNPVSVTAMVGRILCGDVFTYWINKKQYTKQWVQDQLELIKQFNPKDYIYYYCLGQINNDIDALNKCLELNPSMTQVLARKGIILADQNKIEEAIKVGQSALQINENSVTVLRFLGYIYRQINIDTSVQFFLKSLEIYPNQYLVLYNLGIICVKNKNNEKAIEYFDKSLSICPYFKYSIEEKVKLMQNYKNEYREIIIYIEKLFKEYGELEFLYFNIGYSFNELGDKSKALYYYVKSLLYEEQTPVMNNIGVIYQEQKEYEKAQEYFQKAIDKKNKKSFINMFDLLIQNLNQEEKAKEYLYQLLELDFDVNSEKDCTNKILAYLRLKQYKEFFAFSEIALKQHPSSKDISSVILDQIKQEDFIENLFAQFNLSYTIQNNQGINLESTQVILKYLRSNNMPSLVVSHILKYIIYAVDQQLNIREYYEILRSYFNQYINQDTILILYKWFKRVVRKQQNLLIQNGIYFSHFIQSIRIFI